ncbi:MAG TPA: hypothetical protein IAA39_04505 [Candidatus Olsenella avistercoris]|nr:hypothetical protein [Candidatus Olsenella avistercoris]
MWFADSRPLPDDRHVCVIYLSRAGKALDADGRLVEAEPSPASEAAAALERLLCERLFSRRSDAPHGQSLVMVNDVVEKDGALVTQPDLPSVLGRCETIVVCAPARDGHLARPVEAALAQGGPHDFAGHVVWPVCTLADSTGTVADMARDLRRVYPGATVGEPLALLGEKGADFEPQLAAHLDDWLR